MNRFILLLLLLPACRPLPDTVPLPTRVCVRVQHHSKPVPHAGVRVKFNSDSFPGYDRPLSYFDTVFTTDGSAYGCLESLPEGTHWLLATGVDSFWTTEPIPVYGSLKTTISLRYKPELDTILYVSE